MNKAAVVMVTVVIKVMVRAGAVTDMLVKVLTIGMLIDVTDAVAIDLEIAAPVPYSADVLADVAADMLMDALTDMILGVLPGIGVDVLMDVNVNAFRGAITVEFVMSAPLGVFNC